MTLLELKDLLECIYTDVDFYKQPFDESGSINLIRVTAAFKMLYDDPELIDECEAIGIKGK